MRRVIIVLVTLVLLLVACAKGGAPASTQTGVLCPDGSTASSFQRCPSATPASSPAEATKETAKNEPQPVAKQPLDPKIQAFIDKANKVQSMSFLYATIEKTSADAVVDEKHTYKVRGTKAKVEIERPAHVDPETFVEVVYLDFATAKAKGYCTSVLTSICSFPGERSVTFEEYAVKLPWEWIPEIPPSAYIKSSKTFINRPITIIRFEKEGKYYEYYLDDYTGMPLRVAYYSGDDYTLKQLVGGVEYHNVGFNNVLESVVEPPQ